MRHPSQEDLLAAAEPGAEPIRDARVGEIERHLAVCPACARRVEQLRATWLALADNRMPEPSPLFFEQFPARVSAAIREAEQAGRVGGLRASPGEAWWHVLRGWRAWATAFGLVAAVVVIGILVRQGRQPVSTPATVARAVEPAAPQASAANDESWEMLAWLAEDVDEQEPGDFVWTPGATDIAVSELTDTERAELVRLLEAEMRSGGSLSEG